MICTMQHPRYDGRQEVEVCTVRWATRTDADAIAARATALAAAEITDEVGGVAGAAVDVIRGNVAALVVEIAAVGARSR